MKRQIKETTVSRRLGAARVITYGYDTKVNGLEVIRIIDDGPKKFTAIHVKSGLSICVYFPTATKAIKFVNKYLTGFNFTQDEDDLLRDGKLGEYILNATRKEGI